MKQQRRNEVLLKLVAQRLKQIRTERGLTQEDVYFDTDMHVGRIETGKFNISISTLAELCSFYEVSLVEFFAGIPPMSDPPAKTDSDKKQ